MSKVNLLIATAQNNLAMNRAVEQTARHFISSRRLQEGMLNRVEAVRVLETARCLYGFAGEALLCRIPARQFETGEGLSRQAEEGLARPPNYLESNCQH